LYRAKGRAVLAFDKPHLLERPGLLFSVLRFKELRGCAAAQRGNGSWIDIERPATDVPAFEPWQAAYLPETRANEIWFHGDCSDGRPALD
jgi:hypothetical protein